VFVYLVENIITEELDYVPVTSFGPSRFTGESMTYKCAMSKGRGKVLDAEIHMGDLLRPFIDEAEFAQKPHQSGILELTHEFTFQPVDGADKVSVRKDEILYWLELIRVK
jgi:hypothetical protein